MRTDTSSATSAIFAANRARGSVAFDVHLLEGVTHRRHLHESGTLRDRFPSPEAEGLSAVFWHTPGCVGGAGRVDIDIATGEGRGLRVTIGGRVKVYRGEHPTARPLVAFHGGTGPVPAL